mmetsp:Transcript_95748/g.222012  ORF Transcript_95748/g.222012 Transcript_95748/m.222012 type:complete len:267 (-) Transcript_95748:94-894(-)|eukprot:CAMPEP_0171138134 /NCGR_PEP_ID=MMETSP0766_2-20121228/134585_1 /TAXON_ID=439317 /ORGANISM="Gambierdiscus australes, Strain CAWD 149" /LENGTH=266 /DNA_ID=CAMNT_0011601741 /DNA_START=10 /DNA_END=810 /DNA_ORIENTATION=-
MWQGLMHGVTKVVTKEVCVTSPDERAAMTNELRIWRRARHSNIVLFHGLIVGHNQSVCIVLERVNGCSLLAFVPQRRESGAFAKQVSLQATAGQGLVHEHRVLLDVVRAMRHLHKMKPPIFHLGLRPSSVLVDTRTPPCSKISDFSLSRSDQGMECLPHPMAAENDEWRACAAPELLDGRGWGEKADVFAFGRLVHFTCMAQFADSTCLLNEDWGPGQFGSLARLQPVAGRCLVPEPTERPNFEEVHVGFTELEARNPNDGSTITS